jgi:citrate synthase
LAHQSNYSPGLEGVIAAQTRLSSVNGQVGELVIGGFAVEELAPKAQFEEAVYLLWRGSLPNLEQLEDFKQTLARSRNLPDAALSLLQSAAKNKVNPMDALRMAAGALSLGVAGARQQNEEVGILAALPTIVAAYRRLSEGKQPMLPREDLSHAANFLYMLDGEEPAEARVRGLETYMNTVIDHGFNASTFAARVIASTQSDMVSAVTGAIGALKGPLHGGAPGPALDMVFEIGEKENAKNIIRGKLENGERLMGFGHRIYKVRDPRADVLGEAAKQFYLQGGDAEFYDLVLHVEQVALALLEEYKPGRNLKTNVEFYTALLLHGLGLQTELFTPTFAIAHANEQRADRLLRPAAEYIGVKNMKWLPIGERA